jgi:hypothetical protein
MVAQMTLAHLVRVRILSPQPKESRLLNEAGFLVVYLAWAVARKCENRTYLR